MMSIFLTVAAIITGVVLVATGIFSLAALLWDDFLESDRRPPRRNRISKPV